MPQIYQQEYISAELNYIMNNFINLSDKSINLSLGLNQLQQKGSLVYEYNPLRVLRINEDKTIDDQSYPKGSLVNLDTELLNFDLNHPVDIVTQQSYDGSVNLIINDGTNYPKLINTRFSSTGMDTYQIVDREGDNDTNIYDEESFESDISLYKKINNIVTLTFTGLGTDGNLPVGNYVFYFKLADSDGNETDFIAESGIVTCHIGNINDPFSIQSGIRDENSYKSVSFLVSDIDSSYNHVVVYYTRSTSDVDGNEITTSFKINKNFNINNGISKITINGFESKQSVSINDINVQYNVVDSANTAASCQNMLFLGNVHKPDIPYLELSDLSLRLKLQLNLDNNIGYVNENYVDESGKYEYYNTQNIYYKLGYWNDEIYRFGIVYILNDYTLSPVFNLRGHKELTENTQYEHYDLYLENGDRNYIPYNKETFALDNLDENAKGVFKIKCSKNQFDQSGIIPIGLNLEIPNEIKTELTKYTKGFFLVRQKRIPTILCQMVPIGLELISHLPVLPIENNKYIIEKFFDQDRLLTHDFGRRIEKLDENNITPCNAALCPEFELKQPFFNQLFTVAEFPVTQANSFTTKYFQQKNNYFYNISYGNRNTEEQFNYTITAVGDNVKTIKGKQMLFSSRAGEAEEAQRISYIKYTNKSTNASNIIRGIYGPYLGLEGSNNTEYGLYNIRIPNYDEFLIDSYFSIRYDDASAFYAISDRISWDRLITDKLSGIFRGDCFIGNYTHRMVRNFQDPSAPINDDIVDEDTWKENYDLEDSENMAKINRGDVNAVKLGHWATVKVCSNINVSIRALDYSYPSEYGLTGKARGFYPLQSMSTSGESKIPESFIINGGTSSTTSDKYNFEQPKVPAIKNIFNTRIMYSDININDSFKNGFRTYRLTNYRDYPSTYGSITRILEWYGNIIAVFEHGVALIPVNERAIAGQGAGGNVFINTSNVLPENPKVLSDTFGTQWSESVIKTPYYIYGVDTVGKKIWRTNGQNFETISDFKLQKFLNENITLSESEKTPTIGLRNVKSHYNAFKKDVMFTFYDDLNIKEEKVWNLCYNEILQTFVTFYSWIPSYSENIDNIFFSFDRNTSKEIAKLDSKSTLIYLEQGNIIESIPEDGIVGTLKTNVDLDNIDTIEYYISDKRFDSIYEIVDRNKLKIKSTGLQYKSHSIPIKAVLTGESKETLEGNIINVERTIYNTVYITQEYDTLTTAFWKHGKAGLMKVNISPTNWYGKQHHFEFECIVLDNPSIHKIFNNLEIISNKAQPESFHYEIVGEAYDFSKDKPNMYYRQEATKEIYQNLGSNISYNSNYTDITPNCNKKSTIFPLYYSRKKELDKVEDLYEQMKNNLRKYENLSGSEIVYDDILNEFRIAIHKGAYDISNPVYGRLRGNMDYLEDKWIVEIPSITYMQKNEDWKDHPPLVLNWIPNDLQQTEVTGEILPNTYDIGEVSTDKWTYRKETKIRDKYLKVKIRYSGEELAIITALKTLYNISYA